MCVKKEFPTIRLPGFFRTGLGKDGMPLMLKTTLRWSPIPDSCCYKLVQGFRVTCIIAIDNYGRLGKGDIKEIADIKIVNYLSDNR